MRAYKRITASLAAYLFLLQAFASSQTSPSQQRYTGIMSRLEGQTLSGKWVDLPAAAAGKPAVVIFSFSRAAGHDAQNWTQHLSKGDPQIPIYTIIFLETVPRLFRSMAASAIKSEIPISMQDRTILLYRDEGSWKQRLQLGDESHACVTLVRANGEIQWMSSDSFTGARYSELTKQIRALK